MSEWAKTVTPFILALLGAIFAFYSRVTTIEKSVALIEWRLDHEYAAKAVP